MVHYFSLENIKDRDVAQLVARHVRDVEVGSSSLLIPTEDQGSKVSVTVADTFSFLRYSSLVKSSKKLVEMSYLCRREAFQLIASYHILCFQES